MTGVTLNTTLAEVLELPSSTSVRIGSVEGDVLTLPSSTSMRIGSVEGDSMVLGDPDMRVGAAFLEVLTVPILAIPVYLGSTQVSKIYLGDTLVDGSKLGGSSVY